ncbi:hypothetical protein LJK88_37060 [Paenibacillus sp. P26]|nr:hypothetical protein LJK88_37060 [Paenibacillus sp. P26]UUZ93435.1 hypothetical protein LJK87_01225 [Paenibacillus sp. P25]
MECTFSGRDTDMYVDLNLDMKNFLLMLDNMREIGFIDSRTQIFAKHISHKFALLHEDMQRAFTKAVTV